MGYAFAASKESNMDEIFYYCQECDGTITIDRLALLNEGKCPECGSTAGFSSESKASQDVFDNLTMVNDSDLLKAVLDDV
jgi:transcription initiation factor IIE alpha subunit